MRILIFLIIDGEYCGEWILALIPIPQVIRQLNALFPGAQSVNSDVTMKVRWLSSADNDAWVFTYTTSMSESGGDRYGSALFNWAEVYRPTLQSVNDGSWTADNYWRGLESGVVSTEIGDAVPDDVVSEIESTETEIYEGNLYIWAGTEFEGEDDTFLFESMSSYVDGVEGDVPSN